MSETRQHDRLIDAWNVATLDELNKIALDPARILCVADADPVAIARAVVALANTRGGDALIGCSLVEGRLVGTPLRSEPLGDAVAEALKLIDPPAAHLVRQRVVSTGSGVAGVLRVRLSPTPPHLTIPEGGIFRAAGHDVRPLRSRRELDDLYARGRGERERADRQVDGMIAKLSLGHYAFYSLAIVACTHEPSAEPYRSAQTDHAWLAPLEDPFVAESGLAEQEATVGPGEIELRTPGDVNSFIRITRSGCVAVGEVQRRPYHDELDTIDHLQERLARLCMTATRLLAVAGETPLILPHVFVEGIRGLRLVYDPKTRERTEHAPQDTGRYALTAGDARDHAYAEALAPEAMERLRGLFPG